ncbi:MAG: lipopolysaccharide biosynthesis protein [bacterium]|nr:lipopolysaccharide biosynthesis protein [bacterium]
MIPKFLSHSVTYLLARIVPGAVSLLAIYVYSHLLPSEEMGHYALVLTGMDFGHRLFFIWLQMGLVRYLPAFADRRDTFLSTVTVGYLISVAVTVVVGLVALIAQPKGIPLTLIGAGILLLWSNTWFELNLELARADLKPWRFGFLELVRTILSLGLGGFLAWRGYGALGVLIGLIVGRIIPMLVFVFGSWRGVRLRLVDWGIFRQLLHYGKPMIINYPAAWIVDFSDRFLLGELIGTEATGLYSPGYDITRFSLMLMGSVIHLAAFPVNVHALEDGGVRRCVRSMRQNLLALLLVALPVTVAFIMLAPNIATTILGEEYQATAIRLIPFMAVGMFFYVLRAYYVNYAFMLTGRLVFQMWITIAAAAVSVCLNLVLIPRIGLIGAAYTAVTTYIVAFIVSLFYARRIFPLPFKVKDLAQGIGVVAVMALALWPLAGMTGRLALILQVVVGIATVGGMVLALNILDVRSLLHGKLNRHRSDRGADS